MCFLTKLSVFHVKEILAHEASQRNLKCSLFSPVSEPKEEKTITQVLFLIQTTTNLHERPQNLMLFSVSK